MHIATVHTGIRSLTAKARKSGAAITICKQFEETPHDILSRLYPRETPPMTARLKLVALSDHPKNAPAVRGLVVAYRGAGTSCPGCHRSHWWVRRLTAECAFCGTALAVEGGR
jgi:hypothetical protein